MAFGPNPPRIQAHICVRGGDQAIAFYEQAFGAECTYRMSANDGTRVVHANLAIYGGEVMLHDEFPEMGSDVRSPLSLGGTGATIQINLATPAEVDAALERAARAGATITLPAANQFWGARYGRLRDPFGHAWAFNAPTSEPPGEMSPQCPAPTT